jgi:hypothetical protein
MTHAALSIESPSRNASADVGRLLRLALRIDALASAASAALGLLGGLLLADLLGTPVTLLWPVGAFLLAWAAALWYVASRATVNAVAVWAIIAFNLAWVVGSVVLIAAGRFELTMLGTAFVLLQTAAVALFACLEFVGLRRMCLASAQDRSGGGVGGEEGLDDQLGQRDVQGRAEGGDGAEKGQLLTIEADPQRDHDVAWSR